MEMKPRSKGLTTLARKIADKLRADCLLLDGKKMLSASSLTATIYSLPMTTERIKELLAEVPMDMRDVQVSPATFAALKNACPSKENPEKFNSLAGIKIYVNPAVPDGEVWPLELINFTPIKVEFNMESKKSTPYW